MIVPATGFILGVPDWIAKAVGVNADTIVTRCDLRFSNMDFATAEITTFVAGKDVEERMKTLTFILQDVQPA